MKTLIKILFILITITGCASPRVYDPIEYNYAISTTVEVTRAIHRCNDGDKKDFWKFFQNVNTSTFNLLEFVKYKANSDNILVAVAGLRNMTTDVLNNTEFSSQYCTHKLSNIQASSRIISIALGKPDKIHLCYGDIRTRLDAFEKSYKANRISVKEYKDLINDLSRLENIDTSSCDYATKQRMLEDLELVKAILPTLIGL